MPLDAFDVPGTTEGGAGAVGGAVAEEEEAVGEEGAGEGGKVFLICVTMSTHRVLSPIRGPSRIGSVWAQPSYMRRDTWGKWGAGVN